MWVCGEFLLPLLFWKVLPPTPTLTNPPQALSPSVCTTPVALFLGIATLSRSPLVAPVFLLCSPHARCCISVGGEKRRGQEELQFCVSGSGLLT